MKAIVTLGGVPLAGNAPITWRLTTGTQPYSAVFSVHRSQWPAIESGLMGRPLKMVFRDSRGNRTEIEQLYILNVVPSPTPKLVSFVVADRRWKWHYKLVARDYNIPKKTGRRTAFGNVPTQTIVDAYQYRVSSLNPSGLRWTAREAIEDVLAQVEPTDVHFESFPVVGGGSSGSISVQNLSVRDSAEQALARVLAMVPGAEIFVAPDGRVVVFDASNLNDAREHRENGISLATWAGEKSEDVDRRVIRPKNVVLHYQREVEILLEHYDDYTSSAPPIPNESYLENVIPTTDVSTTITQFDPERGASFTADVPAGTYVPVREWLHAMGEIAPTGFDWTFENIRKLWLIADLDGTLGAAADVGERGTVSARIQAFKTHFRQTFRVNRRYMERVRDIGAIRAALLDPITGARAPASVWGEACVSPTVKGQRMVKRSLSDGNYETAKMWQNISQIPPEGTPILQMHPGPARVTVVDKDLGILRVEWITSPYGTEAAILPFNVVDDGGELASPVGDLAAQDSAPIGPGIRVGSAEFPLFVAPRMRLFILLTIVPAAPNNARQFHRVSVPSAKVAEQYVSHIGIEEGEGPDLEVFVPPGEATARLGWGVQGDAATRASIAKLLGLTDNDPNTAGFDGNEIPGMVLVNGGEGEANELTHHSIAAAAELLLPFADSVMGRVATRMPDMDEPRAKLTLKGNMTSATIAVSAAPSAAVIAVHEFSGTQRGISRLALLPESVRRLVLGIVEPGVGA